MDRRAGYVADHVVLDGALVPRAYVEVSGDGFITRILREVPGDLPFLVHDLRGSLLCPGFVNAHSHAFQRDIRGSTQRRGETDPDDFWSWRTAMYAAAASLSPDDVHDVTRRAYSEMVQAGITCVGEFHYLHHQPNGRPYDDPNELSRQVIRAAEDVGIRLVLLQVYYERGGPHQDPSAQQLRFCDKTVDAYLHRVETLRTEGVTVGLAPHSVRAVSAPSLRALADHANKHHLMIHAHVSEQPEENRSCHDEHGTTPTAVFEAAGCLQRPRGFCGVHAIHISPGDEHALATHSVCACPTTEADLGDGIVGASRLLEMGCNLAVGSDSNAVIDLVQELRALEMNERLASGRRLCLAGATGNPTILAQRLLHVGTSGGALALGIAEERGRLSPGRAFDACVIDLGHPFLRGLSPGAALDAWLLSGTAAPVCATYVEGRRVWSR